jgi:hypothetical protein
MRVGDYLYNELFTISFNCLFEKSYILKEWHIFVEYFT